MVIVRTIDAHAAGAPLRLVVDGFPAPRGATMLEKRDWASRHADRLRRAIMLEPRGHAGMTGAVLTEPVSPGSHAGVLFMHGDGYASMSGHGIVAVATVALERGLLVPGGDGRTILFDTPAGTVRVTARTGGDEARRTSKIESVAFTSVPSFVLRAGIPVQIGAKAVRADLAFGGAFYAIVDSESVGLPIDGAHVAELRRAATHITQAIERIESVVHPLEPKVRGLDGTIFTGPASDDRADLRNLTVFGTAGVDRSPSGTGTAAVLAVLDAMVLLADERPFVQESLIGTRFTGKVVGRTMVGDYDAIVPELEASAWITGEHTFLIDDDDPLREGFRF